MKKWVGLIVAAFFVLVLLASIIYTPLITCANNKKRKAEIETFHTAVALSVAKDQVTVVKPLSSEEKNVGRAVILIISGVALMGLSIFIIIRSVRKDAAKNPHQYQKRNRK